MAQPPRRGRPPKKPVDQANEVPEVPEVRQEPVQARTVPDKPTYATIVTRQGRISRPPRRYLE